MLFGGLLYTFVAQTFINDKNRFMAKLTNVEGLSRVTIDWIDPIFKPDAQKPFKKQEFSLRVVDIVNDNEYPYTMVLQVTGDDTKPQFDGTKMLEGINRGDVVDVTYNIKSFNKVNTKKAPTPDNPESHQAFNNITCTKITLVKKAEPSANTVNLDEKKAAFEKYQRELKDPNIPHEGMKWDDEKKEWVDDLPF